MTWSGEKKARPDQLVVLGSNPDVILVYEGKNFLDEITCNGHI